MIFVFTVISYINRKWLNVKRIDIFHMQSTILTKLLTQRKGLTNIGITFIERSDTENFLSYDELYHSALKGLSYLQFIGMRPKDELVFQIEDNKTFIILFWACILGGFIPVPLTVGQNDEHRQKLFNIWPILNNPYLVIANDLLGKLEDFARQKQLDTMFSKISKHAIDYNEVLTSNSDGKLYEAHEDDIAFIQFSSGSTGSPKGVVLTHKNLLANVSAISIASGYSTSDSMISWMPLTHDMGLIGFHLNPLFIGMNQYLMPTNLFVRRPSIWLDKASEHRVSILCSPNFGYKYVIKHCDATKDYNWDLSNVRLIYNGAEPISEKLSNDFLTQLFKYGLKRKAMCPVYGLAEASLAVSISNMEDEIISIDLDRNKLNFGDKVIITQNTKAVTFVNVGNAIKHCSIRIANKDDAPVEEEIIGNVQIKGINVTTCYYNNKEATNAAITKDGWLNTGDLGFVKQGALYITGRSKDIVFVNGQNYYPHDIERITESIEGVELNKIAIVGQYNSVKQRDETLAFVFHRGNLGKFITLSESIKKLVNIEVGIELDKIIPVKDIPRTTSGKLQRFKLLERYKTGEFALVEYELNQIIRQLEKENFISPENDLEEKLFLIWRKILNHNAFGVTQSFFEIGGNSLKAAELVMFLLKEFDIEVPLDILYERSSIRELVKVMTTMDKHEFIPIPQKLTGKYHPLSTSQRRIYYAWEMDKSSIVYNTPMAFQVMGKIDPLKLENCIKKLICRHDSLRMVFKMEKEPTFFLKDDIDFKLTTVGCNSTEVDEKLKCMVQPFDLNKGTLLRAAILNVDNDRNIFFLDFHHIVSDGLSIYNFIEDLAKVYDNKTLLNFDIGYKDFTYWENENLQSRKIVDQEKYWFNHLSEELPVLDMPIENKRPIIFETSGEKIEFEISETHTTRLRYLAEINNCSLHVLMYSLYNLLLAKYTGQNDLIIGIPVAGRRHPDLLNMVGMFVNNLAVRNKLDNEMTFIEFLEYERVNLLGALSNQDYPFENLVKELHIKRDVSRNPIFDTMFIYQNMGFPETATSEFSLKRYFFNPGFSKFDISMEVFDYDKSINYGIEYSTKLFTKETILNIQSHFSHMIDTVISNPNVKLSEVSLMDNQEYDRYVRGFNNTVVSYSKDKTITQLFEEKVKLLPQSIAVECEEKKLTYSQLNQQADQLAVRLREEGLKANDVVGVLLPRSTELIITILGVLKAGGCYLPIDSELPEDRIHYILTNSRSKIVFTTTKFERLLQGWVSLDATKRVINLDLIQYDDIVIDLKSIYKPKDLAYIIYTSGTTGKPKGVMIAHQSLVNYISWAAGTYVKGESCTFPLYTSISFDLTITSIFTPLITGNKIIIYEEDDKEILISKIVTDNKVNIVKLTPSHLKIIRDNQLQIPSKSSIKRFIVGGEELEQQLAKDIYKQFEKNVEIYNEYGPTEATVGCMIHLFNQEDLGLTVPIGVPAANTQIYILDQYLKPVPSLVKGEMYISGDGLALGYLFNKELSNERFVPNPLVEGEKMYRTGDIARRLNNGLIEFIGRLDQQVKINGYRIELSEIESSLISHPNVDQALITSRVNHSNVKVLNAYYVSNSDIDIRELRNHLAVLLPHYMIPASFKEIQSIPLTNNGKIDYAALPNPEVGMVNGYYAPPKNELEEISLRVWSQVFGKSNLSVNDNFFELGGDSIKAVQISSRLYEEGISLNVKDVLTYHTIEQTCLHVEKVMDNNYEQGVLEGEKLLIPIELWFINQNFKNPNYFNQSVLLKLNKKTNIKLFEKAFEFIIKQHDGLRLNYDDKKNKLYYNQKYLDTTFYISEYEVEEEMQVEGICEKIKASFNLQEDLLIKAAIIRNRGSDDYLFITAHHLIMDGISWRILLEDIYNIYSSLENGEEAFLPRKTISLKDWVDELYSLANSENIKESKSYWEEAESLEFKIPFDFEIRDWRVEHVNKLTDTLSFEQTNYLLKEAHSTYKTNVLIILNTALALSLKEWTGFDKFVVELENHGRHIDNVDASRTLGWFTAMYPVIFEINSDDLGDQIKSIKEIVNRIPDHGLGYGIHKYLNEGEMTESVGLTEIRFNYLGQFDVEMNNSLFSFSDLSHGSEVDIKNSMTTKLEMNSMIINDQLRIEINYNSNAHKKETITWFLETYIEKLNKVLTNIKHQDNIYFTPSDFDSVDLNQQEIDSLFS
jgi:amino acid adenylation domain-containing protein/non-ribosomal peptide synthase protein (TIGR01720 family)